MIRRPPRSTRTDTLLPYTTLFRSRCRAKSRQRRRAVLAPLERAPRLRSGMRSIGLPLGDPRPLPTPKQPSASNRPFLHYPAVPALIRLFHLVDKRDGGPRSEERRVGKECVSTCRSRWSPYH